MSMIAGGWVVPVSALPAILEAARRKPGLFSFGRPAFDKTVKSGRVLPTYDGQGYVLATLLVFLNKEGIDLLSGDQKQLSEQLSAARRTTIVILTEAHRTTELPKLMVSQFDAARLEAYYSAFTASDASGVGAVMAAGVEYLTKVLAGVGANEVALIEIG
jgi:hypothetical protein